MHPGYAHGHNHPFDIRARRSNGFSIFHNMSSLRNVRHCDLVTVGNIPMDADFFLLPLFIPDLYHRAVCDIIGKMVATLSRSSTFNASLSSILVLLFLYCQHCHAIGNNNHPCVPSHHLIGHFKSLIRRRGRDHIGFAYHLMIQIGGHKNHLILL